MAGAKYAPTLQPSHYLAGADEPCARSGDGRSGTDWRTRTINWQLVTSAASTRPAISAARACGLWLNETHNRLRPLGPLHSRVRATKFSYRIKGFEIDRLGQVRLDTHRIANRESLRPTFVHSGRYSGRVGFARLSRELRDTHGSSTGGRTRPHAAVLAGTIRPQHENLRRQLLLPQDQGRCAQIAGFILQAGDSSESSETQ